LLLQANGQVFACDTAGSGDNVALCLHGFPENRFSWRAQLPVLANLGFYAVAPDLRGFGETTQPQKKSDYAMPHLVEDVAALFDALGAQKRILIGHDWGGIIAWHFAAKKRQKLDALIILNAPHPRVAARVFSSPSKQWLRSWYILFFQLPWLPEFLLSRHHAAMIGNIIRAMAADPAHFPSDVLDHYRDAASLPGALTAMLSYYRANLHSMTDVPEDTVIDTATLMIWGEQDRALGPELTRNYTPYVRDFTWHGLKQAGHFVQQDAPDEVNRLLAGWLGRDK
jgi:pimeloyl-ACP methyl ester carboxylesterase